MSSKYDPIRAVELLEDLGLKEYEARCFVALTRMTHGSAKEISSVSEVPRTRVYDAVRALESIGLVEVQHQNPQQFRAVTIDEAARTLRNQYEDCIAGLVDVLSQLDTLDSSADEETYEVWTLTGQTAISNRTERLIDSAVNDIVFVLGTRTVDYNQHLCGLREAVDREATVFVGAGDAAVLHNMGNKIPGAVPLSQQFDWVISPGSDVEISRLVLVDGKKILLGTTFNRNSREHIERAVFARGKENGMVVLTRRLIENRLDDGIALGA